MQDWGLWSVCDQMERVIARLKDGWGQCCSGCSGGPAPRPFRASCRKMVTGVLAHVGFSAWRWYFHATSKRAGPASLLPLLPRACGLRRLMSKCAHWVWVWVCRVWRSSREEASVCAFLAEGAAEVAGWRLVVQAKCECAAFRNRPRSLAAKRKDGKWLPCWKERSEWKVAGRCCVALDLEVLPYSVWLSVRVIWNMCSCVQIPS